MINVVKVCADRHLLPCRANLGTVGESNATVLRFEFFEELNGKSAGDLKKELVALFPEGVKRYDIKDDFTVPAELTACTELVCRVELSDGENVLFKTQPCVFNFFDSEADVPHPVERHPLIGDLSKLKTDSKKNIVDAINEIFDHGGGADVDLSGYVQRSELPKINVDEVIEELAPSINLYRPTTEGWIDNSIINAVDGEIITSDVYGEYCVTPPLAVKGATTYTVNLFIELTIFCYNADGEYLGNVFKTGAFGDGYSNTSAETKADTAFIRLSFQKSIFGEQPDIVTAIERFNSEFMLVEGDEVLDEYIPFEECKYTLNGNVKLPKIPKKLSDLENDLEALTERIDALEGIEALIDESGVLE